MDLRELMLRPGSRLSFRHSLSEERLGFPGLTAFLSPPVGEGEIRNDAGALSLRGSIHTEMRCVCDRCARAFDRVSDIPVEAQLAAELQDEESPDYFLLDGYSLDLDELLETAFILGVDSRCLCREDCKGLCPRCGADLNVAPCPCRPEKDPRLAVLEQLLDDIEE